MKYTFVSVQMKIQIYIIKQESIKISEKKEKVLNITNFEKLSKSME